MRPDSNQVLADFKRNRVAGVLGIVDRYASTTTLEEDTGKLSAHSCPRGQKADLLRGD
jgi:hypothetical protein